MKTAKAGSLLRIESGEYSDYSVIGFFVVLREFDPAAELGIYYEAHHEQKEDYAFERSAFLAFLLAKGLLLEIECGSLHTDSYGETNGYFQFTPVQDSDG